jgi:ADP-ribose pyrophosphatase YjhB (NUDIX family)
MIIKAALLLFRDNNDGEKELLFVRPYDKPYYILPGGKQETNETIENALIRELQEELQVGIENIHHVGAVEGATPDGRPLQIQLFSGDLLGKPKPSAEIEQIRWMTRKVVSQEHEHMTPMSLDHLLPYLTDNNLW